MGFERPALLLLLLLIPPLIKATSGKERRFLIGLRGVILVLLVLCAAGLSINRTPDGVDILLIADRSASVGGEGDQRTEEILQLLAREGTTNDRVGLISFGNKAVVEHVPAAPGAATGFTRSIDANGSNLHDALLLAPKISSPRRMRRILLLSDGRFTGLSPLEPSVLAALENVEVWHRSIGRLTLLDVAAGDVIVPQSVQKNAAFLIRFSILSQVEREATYALRRGKNTLSSGTVTLARGENHFFARDVASEEGVLEYTLTVEAKDDPIPENNRSGALLRVKGAPRVLIASSSKTPGLLANSLRSAGIPVDWMPGTAVDFTPARLAPYKVVIVENLSIPMMGVQNARRLAQTVENGLSALLVTGGENSFGMGGYHKSPVDPLLPVTMDLREEQRRGVMAVGIALDRSGSMMAPCRDKTKMDLANLASAEAIKLLSELDQVSVIAVDSQPHIIVPLSQANNTAALVHDVLQIESMGGGIFVHTALEAVQTELAKTSLPTRHIVLFSDAADSEEQNGCLTLAADMRSQGIMTSVIALGKPTDSDSQFLRDLAAAGGGMIYFTNDAIDLPRIFSQEIIRISQRGFVADNTNIIPLPELHRFGLSPSLSIPTANGYNVTSLRENAACGLASDDEYNSPLLAYRRKGRISCASIMFEADGRYTGALANWKKLPQLFVNTVRMAAGGIRLSDAKMYAHMSRGAAEVSVELDDALANRLRDVPLSVKLLSSTGGEAKSVPLRWRDSNTLEAGIALTEPAHYLPAIDLDSDGVAEGPSVTLPYSPEFLPAEGLDGKEVLDTLSKRTGGRALGQITELFDTSNMHSAKAREPLTDWLLMTTLLILLIEIAEKRTAILALVNERLSSRRSKN